MKFSPILVQGTPDGSPERFHEFVDTCVLAEELGYDRVWLTEHHFTAYGRPANQLLAAHVAAKTERIRIGLAVIVLPFHHPLELAEDIAVLDHLSNGRVDFGVGRGNQPLEFAGFGVDMNKGYERYTESLAVMRKAWSEEAFSFEGDFWQFPKLQVLPKPVQKPLPLWMVGVSERSVRMAAEERMHGLIGSYLQTLDVVGENMALWHSVLEQEGIPAGELQLGHNEFVYVSDTDETAKAEAEEGAMWYSRMAGKLWSSSDDEIPEQYATWRGLAELVASLEWDDVYGNRSLIGSPETVAKKVETLESYGIDELLLFTGFGNLSGDKIERSMRLFAREVLPAFKNDTAAAATSA